MTAVLLATDADWIEAEVDAAIGAPDVKIHRILEGRHVLGSVHLLEPDLVVLDLQIGNMGGFAVCMEMRLDEGVGRIDHHVPVLMLLDRRADTFLAERAQADGWLIKPLDPFRLARAVDALLDGGSWAEGIDPADPVPAGDAPGI